MFSDVPGTVFSVRRNLCFSCYFDHCLWYHSICVSPQMDFLKHFPPSLSENACVWHAVLLRSFCLDVRAHVVDEVLSIAKAALDAWQETGYRLGDINALVRRTFSKFLLFICVTVYMANSIYILSVFLLICFRVTFTFCIRFFILASNCIHTAVCQIMQNKIQIFF